MYTIPLCACRCIMFVCVYFVEGNPDYTHSVSHLRQKGRRGVKKGRGRERVREAGRGWGGCSTTMASFR